MNQQRILSAALDCISRFKSSKHPLKNVANDVIAARTLNSSERKLLFALVFAWARQSFLLADFLKGSMRFYKGLSEQDKDRIALQLIAVLIAGFFDADLELKAIAKDYEAYLETLGDKRFLIAVGEFIASELKASFGDQAQAVAKGLFEPPQKWLAFDKRKITKSELCDELQKLKIPYFSHAIATWAIGIKGDFSKEQLPKAMRDHVWFMDAGSQVVAELVKPLSHERVLDMCVGEGGKAQYITMNPCSFVALDINGNRLKIAKKRLSNPSIQFIEGDATTAFFSEPFDWILLDAPCSGSGTLRRHPDLIYRLNAADLAHYQQLQYVLLQKAITLLAPKGKLIYATCSLFASENKQQIDRLLAQNKELIAEVLGTEILDGQIKLSKNAQNSNSLELIPHIHDCDGFFAVVITKSSK